MADGVRNLPHLSPVLWLAIHPSPQHGDRVSASATSSHLLETWHVVSSISTATCPRRISVGGAVAAVPCGVLGAGIGAAAGATLALTFAPTLLPFWVVGGAWTGAILGIFGGLAIGVHMGRFAAQAAQDEAVDDSRIGRSPSWRDGLRVSSR